VSQTPYGPEDLAVPPLSGTAFLELLADNYTRKLAEPPQFYRELIAGSLTTEQLRLWVLDQHFYWDYLYFSTAAIYIKTNEHAIRAKLLRRLVWVEGKNVVRDVRPDWTTPAYEELLARLGEALGVSRAEIEDWQPYTRTFFSVSTLCMYARGWEWSWLDGIANLYASDLYYRDVLAKVRDALADRYGVSASALEFFDAVVGDAEENIAWEQEVLDYWACTTERQLTAARAFRERLDIEAQSLVGLTEALAGRSPFKTPRGTEIPSLLGNEIVPVEAK
jgi:pyrroloquinoline quinone (PQQ) biosynthesis protein C